MMTTRVLDAGPMVAYLKKEEGGDVVNEMLLDPECFCYAHAVNLCEVYYEFYRGYDDAVALSAINDLFSAGVILRDDLDPDFWRAVGRIKVSPGKISLADSFLLALAQRIGGEVVTTDHHEMDRLALLNRWRFLFIR